MTEIDFNLLLLCTIAHTSLSQGWYFTWTRWFLFEMSGITRQTCTRFRSGNSISRALIKKNKNISTYHNNNQPTFLMANQQETTLCLQ